MLVTGAAGGIGAATVARFAAEGAVVTALDRRPADLDATPGARGVVADVTDPSAMAEAVERAAEGGRLDVCVANAGVLLIESFLEGDVDGWRRVLDANALGVMVTLREAARAMVADGAGGRLIVNASAAGLRGAPGAAVYSASKGAVLNLVQGLARELAGDGITVNAVAPSEVDGGMNAAAVERLARLAGAPVAQMRAEVAEQIPLKRLATVGEVAGAFSFLASSEADYMTGEVIRMDGGVLLA